ncbi:hypothetical protein T492DRAFT_896236 [Pavlovales sp. CCMP2436]|nr:hypothetical protein T492DRAFT_896236 [Pavlovales sp. CCMP2436]
MFHLVPLSPYLDIPLDRRGGALLRSTPTSLLDRELSSMFPGMGLGMGGLGGMGNMLEDIPRTLNQVMKVETSADQAVHVCFEDMAGYDQLHIDCNSAQGTLTVRGSNTSANHAASASRTISLPCEVIKPELVTAETRGGRVVVFIPREAQALKSKFANPALVRGQKKALKVNIIGQGEERSGAMSP